MSYIPLPPNTIISNDEFIRQMNLALPSCYEFDAGMKVKANDAGYSLEKNGVEIKHPLLLSEASKKVLGK